MIKQNVNFSQFCDSFSGNYKNNFTYEGKRALFDYLENESMNIELDIIALCCDYTQFDNLEEAIASYPDIETLEDLEDKTQVIKIEGSESFIIQNY